MQTEWQFDPAGLLSAPGGMWVALAVWAALAASAIVDARTGRIPDAILLAGAGGALTALLVAERFDIFFWQGITALLLGGVLWLLNEVWFRRMRHDAIGMGDVKWSMLAVLGFGLVPVLWSWALAAWLGLGWMGIQRLRRKKLQRVYFAPFLLLGLLLIKLVLRS